LEIASYGLSDTTLEEIFLILTTRDENGELKKPPNLTPNTDGTSQQNITLNTSLDMSLSYSQAQLTMNAKGLDSEQKFTKLKGKKLYVQQFGALMLKRLHHHRRNFRVLATNLLLPCFFVALSMAFTSIKPRVAVQPSLEMTPRIYNPNGLFLTLDNTKDVFMKAMSKNYVSAFSKTCAKQQSAYSTDPVKQNLYNLCSLVSSEKCSLIYEYQYADVVSQGKILIPQ
jgi:hypothetical protein